MRQFVSALACSFFLGALLGVKFTGAGVEAKQPVNRVPIEQPNDWVPFSADLHITINGKTETGRIYRNNSGSVRTEHSSERRTTIHINNFTKRTSYVRVSEGLWMAGPLNLPETAMRPLRWSSGVVGLSRYPHRLEILAGGSGSFQAEDGLDAWLYVNDKGLTRLMVPALNFLPVVTMNLEGRRTAISRVTMATPDESLFEPPVADQIKWSDKALTLQGDSFDPHSH